MSCVMNGLSTAAYFYVLRYVSGGVLRSKVVLRMHAWLRESRQGLTNPNSDQLERIQGKVLHLLSVGTMASYGSLSLRADLPLPCPPIANLSYLWPVTNS